MAKIEVIVSSGKISAEYIHSFVRNWTCLLTNLKMLRMCWKCDEHTLFHCFTVKLSTVLPCLFHCEAFFCSTPTFIYRTFSFLLISNWVQWASEFVQRANYPGLSSYVCRMLSQCAARSHICFMKGTVQKYGLRKHSLDVSCPLSMCRKKLMQAISQDSFLVRVKK